MTYSTAIYHDAMGKPAAMFRSDKGSWRIPVEVAQAIAMADEVFAGRIRELEDAIRQHRDDYERCFHSRRSDGPLPTTGIHADLWSVL